MKASQIRTLLSSKKKCRKVLVLASNELPRGCVWKRPKTFIVNTEPNYKRGLHWVVIHLPRLNHLHADDSPYFFDPLGFPPSTYSRNFVEFLQNNIGHTRTYFYNTIQVQHKDSIACGMYCIYFIIQLKKHARHLLIQNGNIINKMSIICEDEVISHVLSC